MDRCRGAGSGGGEPLLSAEEDLSIKRRLGEVGVWEDEKTGVSVTLEESDSSSEGLAAGLF